MATGGLYGQSSAGIVSPQSGSESSGLYGNNTVFGGSYFEWFIFQVADVQPATPTGGSWDFTTNTGTPPSGWLASPPANPTNTVWVSVGVVSSKNNTAITWSEPGKFSFASGLPILSGSSTPLPGDGQSDQLYIETGTTPETIWFKQAGTWTRLTGSNLYMDLVNNQTIGGTKTFSSEIQGSISGTSSNVTGIVDITHGGTGSTTASAARTALGAAASGANSDITSLTAITNGISTPDFIQFDTGITPTTAVGKLQWDPTWQGPQIGMGGGNVNLQIGQETLIYVHNTTGSTLVDGQVVYVTGSQGQRVTVALAQANSDSTSAAIIGMVTENIPNNSSGFVNTQGMVNAINTSGFTDGSVIYLSPTTAGAWTATKPQAPQHTVMVGYIVKGGSVGAGSVYINTQNGYELDELHDVKITSRAAYNLLRVNSTNTVWENIAGPTGAVVGTTDTQTLTNKTISGSSNTLSNISNASLTNSAITINGSSTALGGSVSVGTVTSVGGTGTVNGLTLTGTVTSTGNLTLGGTLSGVANSALTNSAITFGATSQALGSTVSALNAVSVGQTTAAAGSFTTLSASSTLGVTGTATFSGALVANGNTTIGNADTDTITQAASYVTGTQLKSAKTATNTLNLAAYDTDGLAYTNLVTLTASTTPTLALTSAGVGTINNMSIGATTASTGAFTTLSASGNVTLGDASTDTLNVGNGGLVKDASGNVGIGTTTPATALEVKGSSPSINVNGTTVAAFRGYSIRTNGTEIGALLSEASLGETRLSSGFSGFGGFQTFYTNGLERARIDSSGNVGIGTSSPVVRLHVAGRLRVVEDTSIADLGSSATGVYLYNRSNSALTFGTNDTERMRLDSAGNLGLGVTPSAWGSGFKGLDIGPVAGFASESTTTDVVRNAVYTTAWTYKTTSVATLYRQNSSGVHAWYNAPSGTAGAAITFTQAMTLDANGNLQIGTTNAGVGGLGISPDKTINFAESATTAYSTIFRQASNATLTLNFGYTRSSTAGGWASSVGTSVARSSIRIGAGELYFYTNAASTVAVGTDITPTERMRLDSSGNLCLGVTPSAWSTSGATTKVLEMYNGGPNGSLAGFSDGSFQLSTNAYYGAGAWAYKTTDAAANYFQQTGKHVWRNATSGTAGSALTWTTTMTLDANGNLGVGTSSPSIWASKVAVYDGALSVVAGSGSNYPLKIYSNAQTNNQIELAQGFASSTDNVGYLYNRANAAFVFGTNNTERMRIDSSGNLLVGTTSGSYKVEVAGDVNVAGNYRINGVVTTGLTGGQTGSAPLYGARAWVNFNGTGTVAIRASGNVSSITDNGVGDYTVNLTTAMPDGNYSCTSFTGTDASNGGLIIPTTYSTSSMRVAVYSVGASPVKSDWAYVNLNIFR